MIGMCLQKLTCRYLKAIEVKSNIYNWTDLNFLYSLHSLSFINNFIQNNQQPHKKLTNKTIPLKLKSQHLNLTHTNNSKMVKHLTEQIDVYIIQRQLNIRSKKIIPACESEQLQEAGQLMAGNLVWNELIQSGQYVDGDGDDEDEWVTVDTQEILKQGQQYYYLENNIHQQQSNHGLLFQQQSSLLLEQQSNLLSQQQANLSQNQLHQQQKGYPSSNYNEEEDSDSDNWR